MAFPRNDVDKLLVAVHRRCCICHRFCGVKMETDHIIPGGEDGVDAIENAIPVCFECHAEIHSYNDKHPRGRKFQPEELREHKEQWLRVCRDRPDVFAAPLPATEVGPLQAMIDELEFDVAVAKYATHEVQGCLFLDGQFRRAIEEGAIALVRDDLKSLVIEAYVAIGRANQHILAVMPHARGGNPYAEAVDRASRSITDAAPKIIAAQDALLGFLGTEKGAG
jgi:hypothetical protein